jgi:hypothetical protein
MDLFQAMTKATSIAELNDIFENNVKVELGWVNDRVTVDGYQGVVTTDFIAGRALRLSPSPNNLTSESAHLAELLLSKVFRPLKNLVESPENRCTFYQFVAFTRISWTPPPVAEFSRSAALKHAMVLGCLDNQYCNW